ncbi:MAG: trypsin-like peptidase domain-containing protein [Candidatus Sericytochromatia bacterium]|uniref:Trypsin-like peptidase domain-containing protein n=1 Tax=Candidatus Tanganyikabacteria bacterium TaxID=2961651 RepID=A0A938BMX6_9BACT|nr:trypsin-like peptidase domain-containing protein [Candidatus Tanganyikabacteria bacterium]
MGNKLISGLTTVAVGFAGGAAGTATVLIAKPPLFAAAQAAPAAAAATTATHQARTGPPEIIADLVERVGPAVVNIDTVTKQRNPFYDVHPFMQDPFFGPFGGFGTQQRPQKPFVLRKGIGSGFIIDPDGLIVTNNHVVAGASELSVTLPDGKKLKGKVLGKDPGTDLALVKVDGKNLPTLPMADPASLRVGEWVVAIGSPLGLQHTVTSGILSAMNRDVAVNPRVNFLQTDAPINPGNSGGPLLNLRGEVIGVNTAVSREGQGIGFAIPVSTVNDVIPQLKTRGTVERPWLGVAVDNLPEERGKMFYPAESGALVTDVTKGGPADKIGLQAGDIILEVNGRAIHGASELIWAIAKYKKGDSVKLLVSREGQKKTFTATLDKMPDKLAQGMRRSEEAPDSEE